MTALSHFSNFLFQHIICRIRFIYFKHCLFHRTHTCFITIYNILKSKRTEAHECTILPADS